MVSPELSTTKMFVNNQIIKINDFPNICRTCLSNKDLKPINNHVVINVLENIAEINLVKNDDLPQQICENCIKKIEDIYEFATQCKSIDSTLKQCLNDVTIKEEITIDEHDMFEQKTPEFIDVNIDIKQELNTTEQLPEENEHKCDTCNKTFKYPWNLKNHQKTHNTIKPYKCDVCRKTFRFANSLKRHKMTHSGAHPHQCDTCGRKFIEWTSLSDHKLVHANQPKYKCDVCQKVFCNGSNLRQHKLLHSAVRRFRCDVCDEAFARQTQLKSHKRVHSDKRVYACDKCNKVFNSLSNLKEHERIHSGVRPFECQLCSLRFVRTSDLRRHERATHGRGGGDLTYACDVCVKVFKTKSSLVVHRRLHSGVKPYQCLICGKEFTHSSSFKRHEFVHYK